MSIRPASAIAAEGEGAGFQITRDGSEGILLVTLSFDGTSTVDTDFSLPDGITRNGTFLTLTIPEGHDFVDLGIEVIDDSSAEPDETIVLTLQPGEGYSVEEYSSHATVVLPRNDLVVTSTADHGEGSLRQAILNANTFEGPDTITFDPQVFADPQTIALKSSLPLLESQVTIDGYIKGRLWSVTGVTVSGEYQHPVFQVHPDGVVAIRYLTIAAGSAAKGGGVTNNGRLVVDSVTFLANWAEQGGGGLANLGGTVTVINSTFAHNAAVETGGGLLIEDGIATVTNCTFSGNRGTEGGGVFNAGTLVLRNTILANSDGEDCVSSGHLDPTSTRNLIETNDGCGEPITSADPVIEAFGYYNGPTKTFALRSGSPAINLGDNASAVDESGNPLIWDQRGNGDPRFVAGYTDIGAFEQQAFPDLTVDTIEDSPLRACTWAGAADCPLRGAIELANATDKLDVIKFDSKIFAGPQTIVLSRPLPKVTTDVTLDGGGTGGVTVVAPAGFPVFDAEPDSNLRLVDIELAGPADEIAEPKTTAQPRKKGQ